MRKTIIYSVVLGVLSVVLFALNLLIGSVDVPASDVVSILLGHEDVRESWRFIVLESRLPQALTAVLASAALAVSGLVLQTVFHNALASPEIFGISSGAGLGVALVMLVLGGSVTAGAVTMSGFAAIMMAAFIGAMAVTAVILGFSVVVRHNVMLLIIGLMIGYLASSATTLFNFFATESGVKSFAVWGMGNFGGVSMRNMPMFASTVLIGLTASILMVKPLNVLLLGDRYAASLGFSIRRTRNMLLGVTGLLTAVVTAFCGPIAFVGLAVPHVARIMLSTDNHRYLLPVTMLSAACIGLLCNLACYVGGEGQLIPLNAVTPIMGAPIIIYVILRRR